MECPHHPAGAMVNSTLALLALLGSADLLGLMPEQIISQPMGQHIVRVPVQEQGLPLTVGIIARSSSAVSPAIRNFISHLHTTAHQLYQNARLVHSSLKPSAYEWRSNRRTMTRLSLSGLINH
jgi:LysR family transcriptional regulator of abg operon